MGATNARVGYLEIQPQPNREEVWWATVGTRRARKRAERRGVRFRHTTQDWIYRPESI